jgi:outer membrane protein OmpA-like peptidoglycan-associated protein
VDDALGAEVPKPADEAQRADAQAIQTPVDLSTEPPPPELTDEQELPAPSKEDTGRERSINLSFTARSQENTSYNIQPVRRVAAILPDEEDSGEKGHLARKSWAYPSLIGLLAGLLLAILYLTGFDVNRLEGYELWPWNQSSEQRVLSNTSLELPPAMSEPDQNTMTGAVVRTSPAAHEQNEQKMLQTGDEHEAVLDSTRQLEKELRREGLIVDRLEGDILKVKINSDGIFNFDSAIIKEESISGLDRLAAVLRKHDRTNVLVLGHTDSSGQEAYNLLLSQRRAKAVESYLIKQDLPKEHLQSEGRGDLDTRNEVSTLDNHKRRVEIIIKPIQED